EPAEVLLRLGKGSVRGDDLAVDRADDRRRRVVEPAAEDQASGRRELIGEGVDVDVGLLELLLRKVPVVAVDRKQVLRHLDLPSRLRRHRTGVSLSLRTGLPGIDRALQAFESAWA